MRIILSKTVKRNKNKPKKEPEYITHNKQSFFINLEQKKIDQPFKVNRFSVFVVRIKFS